MTAITAPAPMLIEQALPPCDAAGDRPGYAKIAVVLRAQRP